MCLKSLVGYENLSLFVGWFWKYYVLYSFGYFVVGKHLSQYMYDVSLNLDFVPASLKCLRVIHWLIKCHTNKRDMSRLCSLVDFIWFCLVWFHLVQFYLVWYRPDSVGFVWFGFVSFCLVPLYSGLSWLLSVQFDLILLVWFRSEICVNGFVWWVSAHNLFVKHHVMMFLLVLFGGTILTICWFDFIWFCLVQFHLVCLNLFGLAPWVDFVWFGLDKIALIWFFLLMVPLFCCSRCLWY